MALPQAVSNFPQFPRSAMFNRPTSSAPRLLPMAAAARIVASGLILIATVDGLAADAATAADGNAREEKTLAAIEVILKFLASIV